MISEKDFLSSSHYKFMGAICYYGNQVPIHSAQKIYAVLPLPDNALNEI